MQVYVFLDGQTATEIARGQRFTTAKARVQTEADAAYFGAAIGDVVDCEVTHDAGFLVAAGPSDLSRYLIQLVAVADPPQGQQYAARTYAVAGEEVTASAAFEPIPPGPVPDEVKRIQGRRALRLAGKLDAAEAAVAGASVEVKDYWADTGIFRRDNALLIALWHGLGGTDDQLDDLFRLAATVPL